MVKENCLSSTVWPLSGISHNRSGHCHTCNLRFATKSLALRNTFLAKVA